MKQFEKWRKENGARSRSRKADARVWRAALELVLNMFGANTFHGCSPIDIEKALKEELGENQ